MFEVRLTKNSIVLLEKLRDFFSLEKEAIVSIALHICIENEGKYQISDFYDETRSSSAAPSFELSKDTINISSYDKEFAKEKLNKMSHKNMTLSILIECVLYGLYRYHHSISNDKLTFYIRSYKKNFS